MRIVSPSTLAREARQKAAADLLQRQQAKTILTPEALIGKGKQSKAAASLMTTLGGQIRPITAEDLKTFKIAVQNLQADRQHVGGILGSEVLKQSRPEDLARAKAEIPLAVPFRFASGVVSFQTSASRQNGESRHIVQVAMAGWSEAVASPSTPLAAAKTAAEQPLRFECDCGRHRYWYRYIATIGGWNQGRAETGFPKIRNPNLIGVACKHVLRVMGELGAAGVRGQIARAIQQDRQRLAGKTRKAQMLVQRPHASEITAKQAAKPRDVERMASRLRQALTGKTPAAARRPLNRQGLEREAAATRDRLLALGMPSSQADQAVAVILAAGGAQ